MSVPLQPAEVSILDRRDVNALVGVLGPEARGFKVVKNAHIESLSLGSDRTVAWPDLEAESLGIDDMEQDVLTASPRGAPFPSELHVALRDAFGSFRDNSWKLPEIVERFGL